MTSCRLTSGRLLGRPSESSSYGSGVTSGWPRVSVQAQRPTVDHVLKTAVITGATGGIGSALTHALVHRGYEVFAIGRATERLTLLAADEPMVHATPMDLTAPIRLPEQLRHLQRLDVLVHGAARADVAAVSEAEPQLWRDTFAVNVVAAAELTQLLLPALRAASGRVIFLNAAPGVSSVPRWSAYVASKAALQELADSLRHEERAHGVGVTTVRPSGTATDGLRRVRQDFGHPFDPSNCISPDDLAVAISAAIETPSGAYPTELFISRT